MATKKQPERLARIRLVSESVATNRPRLEIAIPRGTSVKDSLRVVEQLDSIIEKLTGCPCLSGLDLQFNEYSLSKIVPKFDELYKMS